MVKLGYSGVNSGSARRSVARCSPSFMAANEIEHGMDRTQDQLKKASEHVFYEWDMLMAITERIGLFGYDDVLRNAMLESFVIHFRSLVFFLFPPKDARRDDVLVYHFVRDQKAFEDERGEQPAMLQKARARAGKEVAHLTYARLEVTTKAKPWPIGRIHGDIERAIRIFLRHADRAKLSDKWIGTMTQLDAEH